MKLQGPRAFATGAAFAVFRWYRLQGAGLCVELRRPCFVALKSWMTVPWSTGLKSKSLLDRSVDLLVRIPGLLKGYDDSLCGKLSPEGLDQIVYNLVDDMHEWLRKHLSTSPLYATCFESDQPVDIQAVACAISTGKCSDAEFAQAVALYLSTWLLITRLGDRYTHMLPQPVAILAEHTLAICKAYLCRQEETGLVPWIFATRIALLMPTTAMVSNKVELCREIDRRYSCELMATSINFTTTEIESYLSHTETAAHDVNIDRISNSDLELQVRREAKLGD
ncbi:hypothetical protein M409DRAFT_30960 [Zasmidium cellare ATCC 36951]|uniref:Uncharacterized protein n=1 Tax=Zasmidium cellare ATCC 36951 TaxID=1080233 RepID=A0A6A6BVG9_ZASCE|nr:uncharacterized protein M409DRAFT_30960 [Zasmidium cellare ATCC 36951]KAF2158523.1 hypothetical protein M409DRAFT_30960 [Zasmidium cellare ATCC 36951]